MFVRLGVTQLADIRDRQRDCDERLAQAEALERDAQTAADRAAAAADAGTTGDVLDNKVVRLEQRMISFLSSESDLGEALQRHESAGDVDEAALEDRLKSLGGVLETRKRQVGTLEQQLAKDRGVLETKEQEVVSLERELREASETLGEPCTEVLQQTAKELETLAAQHQGKQQELESLGRGPDQRGRTGSRCLAVAEADVESAGLETKEVTTHAEEAQGVLDRLTGEVSTRQTSPTAKTSRQRSLPSPSSRASWRRFPRQNAKPPTRAEPKRMAWFERPRHSGTNTNPNSRRRKEHCNRLAATPSRKS